jgi:hypothetical protein
MQLFLRLRKLFLYLQTQNYKTQRVMNTTYLAVIYYNLLENKGYDKEIYKHRDSARVRLTNDKKINF